MSVVRIRTHATRFETSRGFSHGIWLVLALFGLAIGGTTWVSTGIVASERWPIRWLEVNGSFQRVSAEQLRSMLDDVLDLSGPEERTGKSPGTDLLDGTVTLPVVVAIGLEPELAEVDLGRLDRASAQELAVRIGATGALDQVRARAIELVGQAKAALDDAGLPDGRRELLELVADGVVLRYS